MEKISNFNKDSDEQNKKRQYVAGLCEEIRGLNVQRTVETPIDNGAIKEELSLRESEGLEVEGEKGEQIPLSVIESRKLEFKDSDGRVIDFAKLMPDNSSLIRFVYNQPVLVPEGSGNLHETQEIFEEVDFEIDDEGRLYRFVLFNKLSEPGDLLKLLHEIGHANSKPEHGTPFLYLRKEIEALARVAQKNKRKKPKKNEILTLAKNKKGSRVPTPILLEKFEKYVRARAEDERNAWAFALRQLIKYRSEGVNLEPQFDTTRKLDDFVHLNLADYEQSLREAILSDEVPENLKNLYEKKERHLKHD